MASLRAVRRLFPFMLLFFVAAAGTAAALEVLDDDVVAGLAASSASALAMPAAVSDVEPEVTAMADVEPPPAQTTEAVTEDGDPSALEVPVIAEWLPELRRCHRRGRRFCDGPRRAPTPHGAAAERAERLGLGTRRTYDRVLSGPAAPELLAEAGTPEESLLWPVPEGTRGRGFGYVRGGRLRNRLHRGVDIPAAVGALVRSTNDGIVIYSDNEVRGYGNLIVVLHGDDTRTLYAHLERAYVFAGQTIGRGEVIGAVGRTGLTRAPHLHFEWRRRAVPRNPGRRFVDRPTRETEQRLYREQLARREEGEARLAERRAIRERRQARRAAQAARNTALDSSGDDPTSSSEAE